MDINGNELKIDDTIKVNVPEIVITEDDIESTLHSDTEEQFVDCKTDESAECKELELSVDSDTKENFGDCESDESATKTDECLTVNESTDQTELLNNSEETPTANDCTGPAANGVECSSENELSTDELIQSNVSETPKTGSNKQLKKQMQNHRSRNSLRGSNSTANASDIYQLRITRSQRIYYLERKLNGRPSTPNDDCEVFCANIPINVLEDVLIPLFDRFGKIWNLRLQMSKKNHQHNAGFAFVRFTTSEAAHEAINTLNDYQIVPGKHLMVRRSSPNLSLFVGNIHRGLTKEQIHTKFGRLTSGLINTIVKSSFYEESKNSGFCILEYDSNTSAYRAKLTLKRIKVWGRQLFVDWSQQLSDVDSPEVKNSTTLFINCLPKGTTVENLTEKLSPHGEISNITLIKDYAFVKFKAHETALEVLKNLTGNDIGGDETTITLARKRSNKFKRGTHLQQIRKNLRRPRSYKEGERKSQHHDHENAEAIDGNASPSEPENEIAENTTIIEVAPEEKTLTDDNNPEIIIDHQSETAEESLVSN